MRHLLFFVLLISGLFYYWDTREVTHGPGVIAPDPPVQKPVSDKDEIPYKNFTLHPQAKISFKARVLSINRYYFDTFAELTPIDVVFSWQDMSDERNLESLIVRQSDRSYHWEMTKPPVARHQMWQQTANMHLISPGDSIADKVSDLRKGHLVHIEGTLVHAESSKGWTLKTSLSREDVGDSSNELLWIEQIDIL